MKYLFLICVVISIACLAEENLTWVRIDSPVVDPLHNGCFINSVHGWIITYGTGVVLRTRDGGNTWTVASKLDSIFYESIFFANPDEGWLCGEKGSLLHTRDGGSSWQKITEFPRTCAFYGVYILEDGRGFLVGMDEGTRKAVFYQTTDRGETWTERSDIVTSACLEPIQFLDADRGYIAGGNQVLRTTDGGRNWDMYDVDENLVIRGLHFTNFSHGWLVGHEGRVFQTNDSGRTWNQSERFTLNRLRSVYFINGQRGFIAGDQNEEPGSLWWTIDAGAKWNRLDQELPDIHRLFSDPKTLWAVGKSGTILSYRP